MMVRSAYFGLGVVATAAAIAGAILPLLPTTPFLLVAAWAFARSSPRAEAWLLAHGRFGPLIADWRAGGRIARSAKRASAVVMIASLGLSAALGVGVVVLAIQAAALAAVAAFLWSRPEPEGGR